jgi:hypothetical protein
MPFSQEMAKYKEKRISYFDLRFFTAIQICLKYVKVPKSLDPNAETYHAFLERLFYNVFFHFVCEKRL